jgi:hypothetical protein
VLNHYGQALEKSLLFHLGQSEEDTSSSSSDEDENKKHDSKEHQNKPRHPQEQGDKPHHPEDTSSLWSSSSDEDENEPRQPEGSDSAWSPSSDEGEEQLGQFENWPSFNQQQSDLNLPLINRVCSLLSSHTQCNTEYITETRKNPQPHL